MVYRNRTERWWCLQLVCRLAQQLKRKFVRDRNVGRLILRAENSSETYTTEFIASLLNAEGNSCGIFDARSANLGVRGEPPIRSARTMPFRMLMHAPG